MMFAADFAIITVDKLLLPLLHYFTLVYRPRADIHQDFTVWPGTLAADGVTAEKRWPRAEAH